MIQESHVELYTEVIVKAFIEMEKQNKNVFFLYKGEEYTIYWVDDVSFLIVPAKNYILRGSLEDMFIFNEHSLIDITDIDSEETVRMIIQALFTTLKHENIYYVGLKNNENEIHIKQRKKIHREDHNENGKKYKYDLEKYVYIEIQ